MIKDVDSFEIDVVAKIFFSINIFSLFQLLEIPKENDQSYVSLLSLFLVFSNNNFKFSKW